MRLGLFQIQLNTDEPEAKRCLLGFEPSPESAGETQGMLTGAEPPNLSEEKLKQLTHNQRVQTALQNSAVLIKRLPLVGHLEATDALWVFHDWSSGQRDGPSRVSCNN